MTKPWLIWYYEGEYPVVPDARLNINTETDIVESVEYPDEPSNWADYLIGMSVTGINLMLQEKDETYTFMKDCW